MYDIIITLILLGFCLVLVGVGYLFGNIFNNNTESSYEKIASYECGFEAFSDAREPFDVKFYLIAILFIIFDVEIVFFFPWILSMNTLLLDGFYIMQLFIIILVQGFAYELRKGCLEFN